MSQQGKAGLGTPGLAVVAGDPLGVRPERRSPVSTICSFSIWPPARSPFEPPGDRDPLLSRACGAAQKFRLISAGKPMNAFAPSGRRPRAEVPTGFTRPPDRSLAIGAGQVADRRVMHSPK